MILPETQGHITSKLTDLDVFWFIVCRILEISENIYVTLSLSYTSFRNFFLQFVIFFQGVVSKSSS